jgi:hypothetical protein
MEWNDMDVSATSASRGSPDGEIKVAEVAEGRRAI